jgi:hypothetical protein
MATSRTTMGWKLIEGPTVIREYPADQTHGSFLAGDLVALSAGEVILKATSQTVLGVAMKDYTASGTMIPVNIIQTNQIWVAEADTTTTTAMCGVGYGINDTAGTQSVDIGDTSGVEVIIVKIDPRDGATTGSGGRVHVKFQAPILQMEMDA